MKRFRSKTGSAGRESQPAETASGQPALTSGGPAQLASPPSSRWPLALVVALAAATFVLNLWPASLMPLWFDEGHTFLMARDGLGALFERLFHDVHPPLFFILATLTIRVSGTDPVSLRLVSIVAATLAIPAFYATVRTFAPQRWALAGAAIIASHPLFFYYSHEARSYALVILLVTCCLWLLIRVVLGEVRRLEWALLLVVLAALLQSHNLTAFLFPGFVIGVAVSAGWRKAGTVLCLEAIAAIPYLPWFLLALGAEGGIAWIEVYWKINNPWLAPLHSLRALGCGANYYRDFNFRHLLQVTGFPIVGGAITTTLLLASWFRGAEAQNHGRTVWPPSQAVRLLWSCLLTLVLMWVYSFIRQPIYVVARYDVIVLPVVLLLLVAGLQAFDRPRIWPLAWILAALVIILDGWGVCEMVRACRVYPSQKEQQAAQFIASLKPQRDLVLCQGYSLSLMVYYLDRERVQAELITFPSEVSEHPGWYNAAIFLRDPDRLKEDARQTIDTVEAALRDGRRVWLVSPGRPGVDEILDDAMAGRVSAQPHEQFPTPNLTLFSLLRPAHGASQSNSAAADSEDRPPTDSRRTP